MKIKLHWLLEMSPDIKNESSYTDRLNSAEYFRSDDSPHSSPSTHTPTQTTEYCAGKQPHGWQSGKVVLLGGYDGQSTKARTMLRPESAQESKDSVVQSSFISAFPAHHTRASTAPGGQPRVVKQIPTQAGAMRKLEFGAPAPAMPTCLARYMAKDR